MIYYIIGQPGAGKTTLSNLLKESLNSEKVIQIDGDDMRVIFDNKDYSENGRRMNIKKSHDIATFLNAKNYDVIISLVSPFKDIREEFKLNNSNVVEIFVHTDSIRGREDFFVKNYEYPTDNYIDLDTSNTDDITMKKLLNKIEELNKIVYNNHDLA